MDDPKLMQHLENSIRSDFLTALLDSPERKIFSPLRELLSLPTRIGGLNSQDPVTGWEARNKSSQKECDYAISCIIEDNEIHSDINGVEDVVPSVKFNVFQHDEHVSNAHNTAQCNLEITNRARFKELVRTFPEAPRKHLDDIHSNSESSTFLTTIPLQKHHLDAIRLRYSLSLKGLPKKCDGCYQKFDISHAMKCNNGGLVIRRHDAIRDVIGGLIRESGLKVSTEPHIKDAPREGDKAVRGDLEITGLTHLHSVDILDVVLVDPDSSSRQNQTIQQILHNIGKNRKYRDAVRHHRNARFVPLAFTTTGVYGRHTTTFFKTLATLLSFQWQVHYSLVMHWVRCRISIAIQRWINTCIRGSRSLSSTSRS